MSTHAIEVVLAIFALLGPAVGLLANWIGRLQERTASAHRRIDEERQARERLEEMLTAQFADMKDALREAIGVAWRNCPLSLEKHRGEK